MPRVAAFVVRWRGHPPVREPAPPVPLAFEVRAVARRAVLAVDLLAERHLPCVARVGPDIVAWRAGLATRCKGRQGDCRYSHEGLMKAPISLGLANTSEARSPCMPAPITTGFPGAGPSLLESVLSRRLNSQIF